MSGHHPLAASHTRSRRKEARRVYAEPWWGSCPSSSRIRAPQSHRAHGARGDPQHTLQSEPERASYEAEQPESSRSPGCRLPVSTPVLIGHLDHLLLLVDAAPPWAGRRTPRVRDQRDHQATSQPGDVILVPMARPATAARATKALVTELHAQGVDCSPRRLEDWRRVGLIPRGHRRSLGRGRGTA